MRETVTLLFILLAINGCNQNSYTERMNCEIISNQEILHTKYAFLLFPDNNYTGHGAMWIMSPKIPLKLEFTAMLLSLNPVVEMDSCSENDILSEFQDHPCLSSTYTQVDSESFFYTFVLSNWDNTTRKFIFELDSDAFLTHEMKTYNIIKLYKHKKQWKFKCFISTDDYGEAIQMCQKLRTIYMKKIDAYYKQNDGKNL